MAVSQDALVQTPRELALHWLGLLACVALLASTLPRLWAGWDAEDWYLHVAAAPMPLAQQVAQRAVTGDILTTSTGSPRFDGEWTLVTCQMTVLALSELTATHPSKATTFLPAIRACSNRMLDPSLRQFGTDAWGEDGFDESAELGHAYLGYVVLALGMHRRIDVDFPHAELHDRLSRRLGQAMTTLPVHELQTYPGETYPTDLATVAAAVAVHQQITGEHHTNVAAWLSRYRKAAIDPDTGWIRQSLNPRTGAVVDGPRGSGTAAASFFLHYADPQLASELHESLMADGYRSFLGFGGVREYPTGASGGWGDVDSGPVLMGIGISPTGFALAGATRGDDAGVHAGLFRTYTLFGMPHRSRHGAQTVTGGALGDALMLAMLTANP